MCMSIVGGVKQRIRSRGGSSRSCECHQVQLFSPQSTGHRKNPGIYVQLRKMKLNCLAHFLDVQEES